MSWRNNLKEASFRGVQFTCMRTRDSYRVRHGVNKVPYRDGAELESIGEEPVPTSLTAVFFGESYESELRSFLDVARKGAVGPFQHPILGLYQAMIVSIEIDHDGSRRDAAFVELELIADGLDNAQVGVISADAAASQLKDDVDTSQALLDDFSDDDVDNAIVQSAIDDASDFGGDADDSVDDLEDRERQLKRSIDDAISELDNGDQVLAAPVVDSLRTLHQSAQKMRAALEAVSPTSIARELFVDGNLTTLALDLYGDPDRFEDILRLNKVRNPAFVPSGIRLKLPGA